MDQWHILLCVEGKGVNTPKCNFQRVYIQWCFGLGKVYPPEVHMLEASSQPSMLVLRWHKLWKAESSQPWGHHPRKVFLHVCGTAQCSWEWVAIREPDTSLNPASTRHSPFSHVFPPLSNILRPSLELSRCWCHDSESPDGELKKNLFSL